MPNNRNLVNSLRNSIIEDAGSINITRTTDRPLISPAPDFDYRITEEMSRSLQNEMERQHRTGLIHNTYMKCSDETDNNLNVKRRLDKKTFKNLVIKKEYKNDLNNKEKAKVFKKIKSIKYLMADVKDRSSQEFKSLKILLKAEKVKLKKDLVIKYELLKYNVSTYYLIDENQNPINFNNNKEAKQWVLKRLVEKIKEERKNRKSKLEIWENWNGYDYPLVGGVHEVNNQFVTIAKTYKHKILNKTKYPDEYNTYIGLEIEFITDLTHNELEKHFIKNNLHNNVYLKSDASIEWDREELEDNDLCYEESGGVEITVLMKESEMTDIVTRVCKTLNFINAYTNDSCGVHVHFDMRNRNYKKVFFNLAQMQDYLFKMVDCSRNDNEYCHKQNTAQWDESNNSHYMGINGKNAYSKFETIEVRVHHGTTSQTELLNWINLLLKIINHNTMVYVKNNDDLSSNTIMKFEEVKEVFRLDENVYQYYNRMIGEK